MQKFLSNAVTAILVICALTVTSLAVRKELLPQSVGPERSRSETRTVPDWRTYVDGQRIGPADAPVTIVEFSDFECPYCRQTADQLRTLRRKYPRDVAVVYRHFPLPYHSKAVTAARASLCASRQGRFEAYHDAIFANQDSLGSIGWARLAEAAAVPDLAAFRSCVDRTDPVPQIERDLKAGKRLGVSATPTFLVNDQLIQGAPPGALEQLVERALDTRVARR